MATGLVTSPVPLSLSGGRPAAPGDQILDLDQTAERSHIASGAITVLAPAEAPKGNAPRDAWAAHAAALGVEVDDDATRDEIRTAVEARTATTTPAKD